MYIILRAFLALPRETTEIPETGPLFHAKKVILKVGSPQTLEEPGCREIRKSLAILLPFSIFKVSHIRSNRWGQKELTR
jgi:hypothetical protein